MWLARTIEDILEHAEGDTEILVGLDGTWAEPPIRDHPRVTLLHVSESIGQRQMTNQLARLSSARYVMKVDAHCAFDQGFDVKMMGAMQDDWTMVPVMRNLHAFNWICEDGHTRYQGPSGPCTECGKETSRDVVWIAKTNPQSTANCFDREPHFQYDNGRKHRPEGKGDLTESMSLQGSCFLMTRERYWALDICNEDFGSWGSQGIEVACKTWFSGGRVIVNHRTWYAHMFRTQGGDFGFPYDNPGRAVERAKKHARSTFFGPQLADLVERFMPVADWTRADLDRLRGNPSVGVLYYTDNCLNMRLARECRQHIRASGLSITSVSLKPMSDMGTNIHLPLARGRLTMVKQILAGLEAMTEDVVFFCEHDVMYHRSHFAFVPPDDRTFWYNENSWRVRQSDGHAVYYDHDSLSQMCAYRELLVAEYRMIVERAERGKFGSHEPGTRDGRSARWRSEFPNLDIRHDGNFTVSRWDPSQFRDKTTCANWREADLSEVEGWGP